MSFIDAGKIVSIFFVIMLHGCLGSYYLFTHLHNFDWYITLFYYTASRVSVPVFVMLSGITTIWMKKNNHTAIKYSIGLQRIKRLIIPVILWSVFYLFLLNEFSLSAMVKILWSPQGLVHLWFLYMLFGLYLLSPVVLIIFNLERYDIIRYIIACWFVFSSLGIYADNFFGISLGQWFGLFTNYQSGFLGYYLLGAYIMTREALPRMKATAITLTGFALSYLLVYQDNLHSTVFNDRFLNFLAPNIVLMSYGVIEVIRGTDWEWINANYLSYTSTLVIGVYLTHEMVLKFFREHFGLVGFGFHSIYFIPLLTVAAFIIAFILSFILGKIQGRHRLFF